MNIVIPMAGKGSRFSKSSHVLPKPLVDVEGQPMIQAAVRSLNIPGKYIFIILKNHLENYPQLESLLLSLAKNVDIIVTESVTDGPARSCLLSQHLINNDTPLLIVNCDQIMDWNSTEFLNFCQPGHAEGVIVTYKSLDPKNSFIQLDNNNRVIGVIEKIPVSNTATVGIYWWKKGKHFVESALSMIEKKEMYNNEFYVGPAYNQLLKNPDFTVSCYQVKDPFLIGTSEDLEKYLNRNKKYRANLENVREGNL